MRIIGIFSDNVLDFLKSDLLFFDDVFFLHFFGSFIERSFDFFVGFVLFFLQSDGSPAAGFIFDRHVFAVMCK